MPIQAVLEPQVENPLEPLADWSAVYRPNVAALILRRGPADTQILLGERRDLSGSWHLPQGGIEAGETPIAALHREIQEETGLSNIDILHTLPCRLRYRFPKALGQKFFPRVGQEQHYFVVRMAAGTIPDLTKASSREFRQLEWVDLDHAAARTVWFKRAVYQYAIDYTIDLLDQIDL